MTRPSFALRERVSVLYVLVMVGLATLIAWPIYRAPQFLVLVVVASACGLVIAALAWRLRFAPWVSVLVVAGALLLLGVPLAVPSRLTSFPDAALGLVDVIRGILFGWKDLLTVDLPVGTYRNLLVPALVVFLVGPVVALLLAWRRGRLADFLCVSVLLAMSAFGLAFGRSVTSPELVFGALAIAAPAEVIAGAIALAASLLWLAWCAQDDRKAALLRAAKISGMRIRSSPGRARRIVLGTGVILVPMLAAAVLAPVLAQGTTREVLRSGIGPDLAVSRERSPLSEYRGAFSDDRFSSVLFTVAQVGDEPLPQRIRIATLSAYDGEVFRVSEAAGGAPEAQFVRVPFLRTAPGGRQVAADIEVDALSGIWLPTAGQIGSVEFRGERAGELAEGFYYNAGAGAGIQTSNLRSGDRFVVRAAEGDDRQLSELVSPGIVTQTPVPEMLKEWMRRNAEAGDGAELARLVDLLRTRGYLSHGLTPTSDERPQWMQDLGDYAFQPSASGHSLARIDVLFAQLLEREQAAGEGESLVAGVGDDEQFAVAVALIAQEMGFPSRVVIGVRLAAEDGLAACAGGACRAGDLAVWTEVQSAEGDWVIVDSTPQHTLGVDSERTTQRDPQYDTDVLPDTAEAIDPPPPVQQEGADDAPSPRDDALDLSLLWSVLSIAAVVLLIVAALLAPLFAIVAAKALRRRDRRRRENAEERIVGGWDEYVDLLVDAGFAAPRLQTRTEFADQHATANARHLAEGADEAVFSDHALTSSDADDYWVLIDEARSRMRPRTLWQRILSAVSLRSFTRSLALPSSGSKPPSRGERGARAGERRAQSS